MHEDNRVYFARRAAEEQARAEETRDAQAAEAHRSLESRGTTGATLLIP